MGYIKSRDIFEALKDELSKVQIERVKEVWGKSILDFESAEPTTTIEQGKWKLSDDDSIAVVNKMFNIDLEKIAELLSKNNFQEYYEFLKLSIDRDKIDKPEILNSFDGFAVDSFDFLSLVSFQLNIFRIPNVKETLTDEIVLKDENGRPIKDDKGKIQKVKKSDEDKGKILFTNNLTDAFSLMTHYNDLNKGKPPMVNFKNNSFTNILSLYHDGISGNFDLYPNREIYLYITHKSEDILNISVSKFYTSCQELYTGGGHGESYMKGLIYNIFDPNSMPAFLIFDEPYYHKNGTKLVDFMPLTRCIIRSKFDPDGKSLGLFFDKAYPDRMQNILHSMISKYTSNVDSETSYPGYGFNFDLPEEIEINTMPYLDNISQKYNRRIIGMNTKKIVIGDRSQYIIGVNNNVKEVVIKYNDFNFDLFDRLKKLEYVTFESMDLMEYKPFKNFSISSIKISKCIVQGEFINELVKSNLEKLSIQSSQFDYAKLSMFTTLKKLSFLYMPLILDKAVFENNKNLKEFEYTQDIYKINKGLIDSLPSMGIKIKKIGI